MSHYVRRRCSLTVPGGSEKMLRKAADLSVDEIVLDLEDGVAPAEKDTARRVVVAALSGDAFAGRRMAVRINAIGTAWYRDDVTALTSLDHPGLTLVLPKVETVDDLWIDLPHRLQALIETAAGLANVNAIAAASPRVEALIIGYADLASSLGRSPEAPWTFVQETVLVAARAHGLQAIDGPNFAIPTDAALDRDARLTAALGFDGKWAIHPSQIGPINNAFTPSAETVAKAWATIARLDAMQSAGAGAGAHEGAMIDEAMRAGALRTLGRADRPSP